LRTTAYAPNHQAPTRTTPAVPQKPARLVACQSPDRPPSNLAGLRESREKDCIIWNISIAYLTSPRDLPACLPSCFPFVPSCSSAIVLRHASSTTTPLPYAPAHHHKFTTSPRKGPTRPAAAPRELLQSDLLTVYPTLT
jgi:hypothetical protein